MIFCAQEKIERSQAFTLIEVLCVIGIVGILMGLLLPTMGMVRKSSLRTQTKAQFYQYIFALEGYFHEYGQYPCFFYEKSEVNLKEYSADFVKALSGHGVYPEYQDMTSRERQKLNPKGIVFYHFDKAEFNDHGLIIDAFGNSDICVSVDTQQMGLLKIRGKKVAAKIGVYSRNEEGEKYEDIESWR